MGYPGPEAIALTAVSALVLVPLILLWLFVAQWRDEGRPGLRQWATLFLALISCLVAVWLAAGYLMGKWIERNPDPNQTSNLESRSARPNSVE